LKSRSLKLLEPSALALACTGIALPLQEQKTFFTHYFHIVLESTQRGGGGVSGSFGSEATKASR